jgi:hypothetical protein
VFLERTWQHLNECVQVCTAELVSNLDEVDISDLEDRKARKALAAATKRAWTIHQRKSRKVRHVSVITCVSAIGTWLTPYMITSHDSPSVRGQLEKHGVWFGTNLIMKSNAKPDINAEISFDDLQAIFLLNLAEFRGSDEFSEEMSVSLMENCPSHITCVVM